MEQQTNQTHTDEEKHVLHAILKEAALKLLKEIQEFLEEEESRFSTVVAAIEDTARPGAVDATYAVLSNVFEKRFGPKPKALTKIISNELGHQNDVRAAIAFEFGGSGGHTHSSIRQIIDNSVNHLKELAYELNPLYAMPTNQ